MKKELYEKTIKLIKDSYENKERTLPLEFQFGTKEGKILFLEIENINCIRVCTPEGEEVAPNEDAETYLYENGYLPYFEPELLIDALEGEQAVKLGEKIINLFSEYM